MTQFTFNFFHAFQISAGTTSITNFHSDKARALLVYLALEPQEHTRSALAALLWPEISDQHARTNLRNTLHRLRQTLDEASPGASDHLLTVTRQTVCFNRRDNVVVDVLRFQTLFNRAFKNPLDSTPPTAPDFDLLAEAVALYCGELLAGFGVADAPPFEEWLLLRREMLQQQALLAFHALTTAYETLGHYERAYTIAGRLLTLDPYREESYQQIMRLLALMGQPEQALQYLSRMRHLLREEVGVDLSEETLALAQQIASGQFAKLPVSQVTAGRESHLSLPKDEKRKALSPHPPTQSAPLDLREVPHSGPFFGRVQEQRQIAQWLLYDQCRVVAILGLGGMGKTTLAAQSIREIATHPSGEPFAVVLWRSLVNAPPLADLLPSLLQTLSDQQLTELPKGLDDQLRLLLGYLRKRRVLLVLDNLESILEPAQAGAYRRGYEPYGQLIQQLATLAHQSHLLLTSRERPRGYERLARDGHPVQSLQLMGLDAEASRQLLMQRGLLGNHDEETMLIQRYSGNPLALKLVADTVNELFGDNVAEFLQESTLVFDDIRTVLDQQFVRLSALEQELLFWLAVERETTPIALLRQNLLQPPPQRIFLEALRNLQRASLLEREEAGFVLQNVVTEYLTDKLVDTIYQEIITGELQLLKRHALLKAQAKAYVRESQARLLLEPIGARLLDDWGRTKLTERVQQILAMLRQAETHLPSYAGGNLLNLLLHHGMSVAGYDFSRLPLWQLDLQGRNLPALNVAEADLSGSLFSEQFSTICAIAFSPDGEIFAAATITGEIRLWQTNDRRLVAVLQGHTDAVWSVVFSPDGATLASGSGDQTVRLWDVASGQLRHTLRGHRHSSGAVAFSPDGKMLASGSGDQTVRIWDAASGAVRHILEQTGWIVTLAFSPHEERLQEGTRHMLACAGANQEVQLWHITTVEPSITVQRAGALVGHTDWVRSVAFSPDGKTVVSGSYDQCVRLWDVTTGQVQHVLIGHAHRVSAVAFSGDGRLVASASRDNTVRLWHVHSGQIYRTLLGHTNWVRAVAFAPRREDAPHTLASGGYDQKICLWDVDSGQLKQTIQGYNNQVRSVSFSADGNLLASSGDPIVRLWDMATGQIRRTFRDHTDGVRSVAFCPQAVPARQLLVSGGYDNTVRLWALPADGSASTAAGDHEPDARAFFGHTDAVQSVAFSPDGRLVASGSDDYTVRVWDVASGQLCFLLQGHSSRVSSVAFCPQGQGTRQLLASGSNDQTIRIWDVPTRSAAQATHAHQPSAANARPLDSTLLCAILEEPLPGFRFISFSPDGQTLASGSYEGIIRLWDISAVHQQGITPGFAQPPATGRQATNGATTGIIQLRRVLQINRGRIRCLAFSPDGLILASGATDHQICLWDVAQGQLLHRLVGHTDRVLSLAFRPDGRMLASGGADETIKLWDLQSGACLQTWRPPSPYEGMNITGVTGISTAQRDALKALGAIDGAAPPPVMAQPAQ